MTRHGYYKVPCDVDLLAKLSANYERADGSVWVGKERLCSLHFLKSGGYRLRPSLGESPLQRWSSNADGFDWSSALLCGLDDGRSAEAPHECLARALECEKKSSETLTPRHPAPESLLPTALLRRLLFDDVFLSSSSEVSSSSSAPSSTQSRQKTKRSTAAPLGCARETVSERISLLMPSLPRSQV